MGYASVAEGNVFVDNGRMINDPKKTLHQSLIRQLEYQLISIGMSVIAYLFERVILRSIKRDGLKP